jgi:hypothetical protein
MRAFLDADDVKLGDRGRRDEGELPHARADVENGPRPRGL